MVKPLTVPTADAKVGLKIDYIAKHIGQVLAPLGFKRKGRTMVAEHGEGPQRHWRIVNLQGNKWNEGSRGEFYVNLALQFPAIDRLVAQMPGQAWLLQQVELPDEAQGQVRARLDCLLNTGHRLAQPEYKVRAETDLAVLVAEIAESLLTLALPQLQAIGSLQSLRDRTDSNLTASVTHRLAAAVALQDHAGAAELIRAKTSHWQHLQAAHLQNMRQWLESLGVDVQDLPRQPLPRNPSAWDARMAREAQAEQALHQVEQTQLASQMAVEGATAELLAASWVAELRKRWRSDPKPLVDLPSGPPIAALDDAGRETVLQVLLRSLADDERQSKRDPIHTSVDAFERDGAVATLLQALLTTLAPLRDAATLLQTLTALQTRLQQDMVTGRYPWGFARLAAWLQRQPHSPERLQGMRTWLEALPNTVLQHWDATERALAEHRAKALDPNNPMYAILKESRERTDELLAQYPQPDPAEIRRRLREYPEQSLAPEDKQAVRQWRVELLRDAQGRLPVLLEPDDFGAPAQAAWDAATPALHMAAMPLIQDWLEGVEAKPTQRWLRNLKAQIQAFEPSQRTVWRAWVSERLQAFEHSGGKTEWASTGARPGVGARLGPFSESLLLGLLWWSELDGDLADDVVGPIWQHVASAAWQRLPEVGARAPAVGSLTLRLLAGLGGAHVVWVAAQDKTKGAKQLAKAAERALAEPFLRA
jgi:hypothetical protein